MKYKIPLKLLELEKGNYHLIFPSRFNTGFSGNWIIDTGASKTVFDKGLVNLYTALDGSEEEVHSAGIGEKPLETIPGILETFTIGKLVINNLKVALLDLSNINNLYK